MEASADEHGRTPTDIWLDKWVDWRPPGLVDQLRTLIREERDRALEEAGTMLDKSAAVWGQALIDLRAEGATNALKLMAQTKEVTFRDAARKVRSCKSDAPTKPATDYQPGKGRHD